MANRSIRTKKNREAFIAALDKSRGNVSDACEVIGIGRTAAYKWKSEVESFRVEWDDVVEKHTDALESKVYERALDGWQEPVFYQGEETGSVTKFSDSNAQFLLRARRPTIYRDNSKIELGGVDGGPLRIEVEFVQETAPDAPDSE